jgi:hypothetical protein
MQGLRGPWLPRSGVAESSPGPPHSGQAAPAETSWPGERRWRAPRRRMPAAWRPRCRRPGPAPPGRVPGAGQHRACAGQDEPTVRARRSRSQSRRLPRMPPRTAATDRHAARDIRLIARKRTPRPRQHWSAERDILRGRHGLEPRMQVGLACLKFAGEQIGRFDGDLPIGSRGPARSPMSRTPGRAGVFGDLEPHVHAACRGQLPLPGAGAAPPPILGCKLRITVPSARRSR